MIREFRRFAWLSVALSAAVAACAASSNVGGESHFVCARDEDCPASAPLCRARSCHASASDAGGASQDSTTDTIATAAGGTGAVMGPPAAGAPTGTGGLAGASSETGVGPHDAGDAAPDAACIVQDAGSSLPIPPPNYSCLQLDVLRLEHPVVVDDSGDGVLSPGEGATLTVTLREFKGVGASLYPGAVFSVLSDAGVTIGANDFLYAVLPCSTFPVQTRLSVAVDVPLHSTFVVRVKMEAINSGGCPNADTLDVPISVGDPLR